MESTDYGLSKTLKGVPFDDAVERVTSALKAEGFGVLTKIDVQATLKEKLDEDFRQYVILGACNPPLAYEALKTEPLIGLLLPCNVVVVEYFYGGTVVAVVNPGAMFSVVDNPDLSDIVEQIDAKLRRVLDGVSR